MNRRTFGKIIAGLFAVPLALLPKIKAKPETTIIRLKNRSEIHCKGEFGTFHGVRWIKTKPGQPVPSAKRQTFRYTLPKEGWTTQAEFDEAFLKSWKRVHGLS